MPVDQDATSLWYLPSDASQWTELLAGTLLANPSSLWLCQEASGNLADSIGAVTFTAFGTPNYQQTVTGWTRKAINCVVGSTTNFFLGASVNPTITSEMMLLIAHIDGSAAAQRTLAFNGGCFLNCDVDAASILMRPYADGGTNSTTGMQNINGLSVVLVFKVDRNLSEVVCYVDTLETLKPTPFAPSANSNIFIGGVGQAYPDGDVLYSAIWTGADAEMSDADVAILISRIKNGIPSTGRPPRRNFMSYPVTLDTQDADSVAVEATANTFPTLLMEPSRDYAFTSTTDCWVQQGPFTQEATKAWLDLADGLTLNVTTVIEAQVAGTTGNSITLETVADGTGVGELDESSYPAIVFHFEDAVTTVQDFEDAVTASTYLAVKTSGVVSNTWDDPDDVFAAQNLHDAVNEDLITPIATAGAGSVFVPALFTVYLDGARGDSLSVIRDTADGVASLTPIARDKIGVH